MLLSFGILFMLITSRKTWNKNFELDRILNLKGKFAMNYISSPCQLPSNEKIAPFSRYRINILEFSMICGFLLLHLPISRESG